MALLSLKRAPYRALQSCLVMLCVTSPAFAGEKAIEGPVQRSGAPPVVASQDVVSGDQRARDILKNMLDPTTSAVMTNTPAAKEFGGEMSRIAFENAYVQLWTRPGLNVRDRSMITVAMLIALGSESELKIHVGGALRNGVSASEIEELFYHSSAYVGFPLASSGLAVAREIFEESNKK